MLVVWLLCPFIHELQLTQKEEHPEASVKLEAPRAEEQLLEMAKQCPHRPEAMIAPNSVVNTLVNDQMVPCLIDTGSEVTIMEYQIYTQRLRTWD